MVVHDDADHPALRTGRRARTAGNYVLCEYGPTLGPAVTLDAAEDVAACADRYTTGSWLRYPAR
jgi:hypothetical protein